jgi:UDP-N-acetylglucosamine 4,6-dehydratase
MTDIFKGKIILVTGGVGSIGSVIVQTLMANYSPRQVRIFDQNEEGLFNASCKYSANPRVRFLAGNIRDKERVNWAMKNVDYVFHAAALKHVALNEYNPFEAIKTNVIGTENVVMAAITNNVKKFINISTDKASIPYSAMGASKLLAERITSAANYYKGKSPTICFSVRFGNVLASSGSVVPIFCNQIKKGGPVTITDKRMIRYFMTIPQAVDLIFKAVKIGRGGEVFILKMPSLLITDLARVLINEYSLLCGVNKKAIKIKEIGRRPGEKILEKLVTPAEAEFVLEMNDMFVIPSLVENPNLNFKAISKKIDYYQSLGAKPLAKNYLIKNNNQLLSPEKIKKLLVEAGVLK